MKKIIFSILSIISISSIAFIYSCQKDVESGVSNKISTNKTNNLNSNNEKSIGGIVYEESFLISAIHGEIKDYQNLEMLEKLLVDASPLNETILSYVANAGTITDEIAELLFVISAPFSNSLIEELKIARPNLNCNSIFESQLRPSDDEFLIVFTNPKTIIFGKNIHRKGISINGCDDCSSEIKANHSNMISLMNNDDTFAAIGGGCNSATQICGQATTVTKDGRGNSENQSYRVNCRLSPSEICIGRR